MFTLAFLFALVLQYSNASTCVCVCESKDSLLVSQEIEIDAEKTCDAAFCEVTYPADCDKERWLQALEGSPGKSWLGKYYIDYESNTCNATTCCCLDGTIQIVQPSLEDKTLYRLTVPTVGQCLYSNITATFHVFNETAYASFGTDVVLVRLNRALYFASPHSCFPPVANLSKLSPEGKVALYVGIIVLVVGIVVGGYLIYRRRRDDGYSTIH